MSGHPPSPALPPAQPAAPIAREDMLTIRSDFLRRAIAAATAGLEHDEAANIVAWAFASMLDQASAGDPKKRSDFQMDLHQRIGSALAVMQEQRDKAADALRHAPPAGNG